MPDQNINLPGENLAGNFSNAANQNFSSSTADAPNNLPTGKDDLSGFSRLYGSSENQTNVSQNLQTPQIPAASSSTPRQAVQLSSKNLKPPARHAPFPKAVGSDDVDKMSQLFSDDTKESSQQKAESLRSSLGQDAGYAVNQDVLSDRLSESEDFVEENSSAGGGMKSVATIAAVIIVIIAIGASVGIFMWYSSMLTSEKSAQGILKDQLEKAQSELNSANTNILSLEMTVSDLEAKLAEVSTCPVITSSDLVVYKEPKSGWQNYFPDGAGSTLVGKTKSEVEEALGKSPIIIKDLGASVHKEVWIYLPKEKTEDGLYLYFSDEKLVKGGLEVFAGLTSKCPIINF